MKKQKKEKKNLAALLDFNLDFGLINSLKRHKDDAKEVKEGLECGIGVDGVKKFIEGDTIEVYEIKEVKRKLELN